MFRPPQAETFWVVAEWGPIVSFSASVMTRWERIICVFDGTGTGQEMSTQFLGEIGTGREDANFTIGMDGMVFEYGTNG